MARTNLVAKITLFNEKGNLLLLRRSPTDKRHPGEWDIPGGAVEENESYIQAVIREIKEETGISLPARGVEMMYTATTFYDNLSTVRFLFVAKVLDGQAINLSYEHDKHAWLPLEEALNQFKHPVWVDGIKYLSEHQLLEN